MRRRRRIQRVYDEAATLLAEGAGLHDRGAYEQAIPKLEEALGRWGTLDQVARMAFEGVATRGPGAVDLARGLSREDAAELLRLVYMGITGTTFFLAMANRELRRYDQAVAWLEEDLALRQGAGDEQGEARSRYTLAELCEETGRVDEAHAHYTTSLERARRVGNRVDEAAILFDLSNVANRRGRHQESLERAEGALATRRALGNEEGIASSLTQAAGVLRVLGLSEAARRYLDEALDLARGIRHAQGLSVILNALGDLSWTEGRYEEALELLGEALGLARAAGDLEQETLLLGNTGATYRMMGKLTEAESHLGEALERAHSMQHRPLEAVALSELGAVHLARGRPEEAEACFETVLAIDRQFGMLSDEGEALRDLGDAYRDQGRLAEAVETYGASIAAIERMRSGLGGEELRTGFFSRKIAPYQRLASVLVEEKRAGEALQVSEQGRARAFIELLAEAQAEVREGVDPELREQQLSLQRELGTLRRRLTQARSSPQPEHGLVSELERAIGDAELRLHALEGRIRAENPRYAALTQPTAWELTEIQGRLLDDDTALLEYVLADEGSLLFCVLKDDFEVFTLPPREEIETKVRELRTAVLHGLHRYPHGEELYRELVAPAADLIEGKDLLVCADGVLHYLPFSLLLTGPPEEGDGGDGESPGGRLRSVPGGEEEALLEKVRHDLADLPAFEFGRLPYLLRAHAISYAPSATVAGMVRAEAQGARSYDADLAAFADPRGLGPERGDAGDGELSVELEAALDHVRDALEPIPATADEVWALAGLVAGRLPKEHPERLDRTALALRTASAATKEEVEGLTSGERSFRFLHIATHGLLDPEKPQFSGLVFTPQHGGDPFWRTFEIFNARIPSELVVLSACETGLGRIVSGEGIVGLTRAFLYAGAPSVCVSLWKVAEESSPALMEAFYRRVLAGEPKAAALQGAQLELMDETDYDHPFWWAPFVLVGER